MKKLWNYNDENREYSSKKYPINMTFGNYRKKILCYERLYTTLTEEELLQLLKDAKDNKWTTLDISDCGIEKIPDELWEISTLKVLYIGNWENNEENKNRITEISEKIENLINLEALSICNLKGIKIPVALKYIPTLVYLDCFGCDFKKIVSAK